MMRSIRSAEDWKVARELVEGGSTLTATSKKTGIPFGTLQRRASYECWGLQHSRGRPKLFSEDRIRAVEANLEQEEAIVRAEASLAKVEDLEILARKSLAAESARAKVMISRRVVEILSKLEDPDVPPRSAAQALGALAPILRLVYRWDKEPDVDALENCNAINLALIHTTPEQLKKLSLARGGTLANEHKGQVDGEPNHREKNEPPASEPLTNKAPPGYPSPGLKPAEKKKTERAKEEKQEEEEQPERINSASPGYEHRQMVDDGPQSPKKEAPPFPGEEARPEVDQDPSPTPGSAEWNRQRLDRLAKERAAWRGRPQ
jgi:hypothetical protein